MVSRIRIPLVYGPTIKIRYHEAVTSTGSPRGRATQPPISHENTENSVPD